MPEPVALDQALYAILGADADVTALLGSGDNLRVYPDRAPDDVGAVDYVVYQLITGESDQSHESAASMSRERWQLDCISHTSAAAAKTLAKRVRTALHGYAGTIASVRIGEINAFAGPSNFEPAGKGYRRIVEIDVLFAEP